MRLYSGNHYVTRFKNGEIWHFFSRKKPGGIYYRILNSEGTWENPVELVVNCHDDFSVIIDNDDQLHLICQSKSGEILYMKYIDKSWNKQILSRYEPSRYVIKYPHIVVLSNNIHILFAIGTAFNIGLWSIYHYHWNQKKWHSQEVTKIISGNHSSPFQYDFDSDNIHLIFRSLNNDSYQIFHTLFDNSHAIWSTPENISRCIRDCNMPSLVVVNQTIHTVWTTIEKSNLRVKHRSKSFNNSQKTAWSESNYISLKESNCSFPHILWLEGKLWCIWLQNHSIYGSCSKDNGLSWDKPNSLIWNRSEYSFIARYSSNYPREKDVLKAGTIFASLHPGLSIPLIETYMDIPKPDLSQTPSPWLVPPELFNHDTANENTFSKNKINTNLKISNGCTPFYMDNPANDSKYSPQRDIPYNINHQLTTIMESSQDIRKDIEERMNHMEELCKSILDNQEKLDYLNIQLEQIKTELKGMSSKGILNKVFGNKNH